VTKLQRAHGGCLWQSEAMKDAGGCDKLRGAANQAMIRRFPNGETHTG